MFLRHIFNVLGEWLTLYQSMYVCVYVQACVCVYVYTLPCGADDENIFLEVAALF